MLRYILRRLLLLIRCCSPPQPSSFCCCGSAPATRRWIIYVCRTCRPLKRWLPRPASCWGSTSRWQCSICTGYGGRCTGFRSLLCHPAPGAGRPAALPAGHPAAHRRGAGADPRHLLPLGIWAARHRDRLPDYIVRLIAFLGVSMPNFWLAFLLVMLFSVHLQWLPAMGYGDWQHLILPAVSIAFMSLAINARLLRASMLDAASQRHVIWARLRGLSARGGAPTYPAQRHPAGGDRHGHAHWRADRRHHDYRKYLCTPGSAATRFPPFSIAITR